MTLFLCGDVMTGRGVDQILAHPSGHQIFEPTGELAALQMTPMQIRKLTLNKPSEADARWLRDTLERVSACYRSHIDLTPTGTLILSWRDATRPLGSGAEEHKN